MNLVAEALGLVGGAIGLSVSLPQAIRVRRVGTFGVSRTTWMLTYGAYACWLGYGIRTISPSQMIVNVIALFFGGWLLIALLAGEKWKWPFLASTALIAPAVIVTIPESIMYVILFAFQATFVPQIVRSWQAWRKRTPIPAVSNLTWALVLISSLFWLAYAALGDRPFVIATGLFAIMASGLILVLTRLANRGLALENEISQPPHSDPT